MAIGRGRDRPLAVMPAPVVLPGQLLLPGFWGVLDQAAGPGQDQAGQGDQVGEIAGVELAGGGGSHVGD